MAIQNKLKAFVRFDGSGRVIPSSLILQKSKPKVGNWKQINATQCCDYIPSTTTTTSTSNTTTTTTTTASFNFDVDSSDWSGAGITDQTSFNDIMGVTTSAFVLNGNNIKATITSLPFDSMVNLYTLRLYLKNITNINYVTINDLGYLAAAGNYFTAFNPSMSLPNSLVNLNLGDNSLTQFVTSIPNSLNNLSLQNNLMDLSSYAAMESWANSLPATTGTPKYINFNGNTASVSGTNLETILISKGWSVNP